MIQHTQSKEETHITDTSREHTERQTHRNTTDFRPATRDEQGKANLQTHQLMLSVEWKLFRARARNPSVGITILRPGSPL